MIKRVSVILGSLMVSIASMASLTGNGATVDPCLNNPNPFVQQSCQNMAAAAANNQKQANSQAAANQPGATMPAWQQALQPKTPAPQQPTQ